MAEGEAALWAARQARALRQAAPTAPVSGCASPPHLLHLLRAWPLLAVSPHVAAGVQLRRRHDLRPRACGARVSKGRGLRWRPVAHDPLPWGAAEREAGRLVSTASHCSPASSCRWPAGRAASWRRAGCGGEAAAGVAVALKGRHEDRETPQRLSTTPLAQPGHQASACLSTKGVGPTPVDHTHRPKGMTRPSCAYETTRWRRWAAALARHPHRACMHACQPCLRHACNWMHILPRHCKHLPPHPTHLQLELRLPHLLHHPLDQLHPLLSQLASRVLPQAGVKGAAGRQGGWGWQRGKGGLSGRGGAGAGAAGSSLRGAHPSSSLASIMVICLLGQGRGRAEWVGGRHGRQACTPRLPCPTHPPPAPQRRTRMSRARLGSILNRSLPMKSAGERRRVHREIDVRRREEERCEHRVMKEA